MALFLLTKAYKPLTPPPPPPPPPLPCMDGGFAIFS